MTSPASDASGSRATSGAPRTAFTYQPALDGVRAIAIAMVMMLHADIRSPWGWTVYWSGWLGVDVFFVLSGFLITLLLLQEVDRRGSIDLIAFYVRRLLRLYPIILLVLVIAFVTMAVLPADSANHTSGIGVASIGLYFTNWLVIAKDSNVPLGPFGHLWSLAIEEQFYLVWPIVVIGSIKLGSRRVGVFIAAVAGAAGSAIGRATIWHRAKAWGAGTASATERAAHVRDVGIYWYRSTFTRADGLLIGCAIAVVVASLRGPTATRLRARLLVVTGWDDRRLSRYARRVIAALGLGGAVVAESIAWTNHHHVYPEFLIGPGFPLFELAVGLVIVNVVVNAHGVMAGVLAWKPLVWIGRRSYAIYVFHPVFIIGLSTLIADTQPVRALAIGLTIVFAGLSYRYYEAPILRLKSRFGAGREAPSTEVGTDGRRPVDAVLEEA